MLTSKLQRSDISRDISPASQAVTVGNVVKALESAMQARDAYTVGHQQRVAEIACRLGEKLGLDAECLEDLRLAAILHDLGKMAIPGEILSKPTRLSAAEFDLIRTHPQVSRDILQPLNLPARVGLIVLQHHERLNGSGYPNSLQGDEILLEARILAVADVLEAMCSHRPYRASLGLPAALAELIRFKGELFDVAVVDACLELYQGDGQGRPRGWKSKGRPQTIARYPVRRQQSSPQKTENLLPQQFLSFRARFVLHSLVSLILSVFIFTGAGYPPPQNSAPATPSLASTISFLK
jgi:putative nucleotidyltransferase with HDIG domain